MQRVIRFFGSNFFLLSAAIFVIAIVRMKQKFFEPQFYAEDTIFFQNAYENSFLENILRPHLNYFLIIPRIIAEIIVEANFWEQAPFLFTIISFAVYAMTLALFASSLYERFIPNQYLRTLLPLAMAFCGCHYEVVGAICNMQWYLVLNALHFLVFLCKDKADLNIYSLVILLIFFFVLPLSAAGVVIFAPFFLLTLFKKPYKSISFIFLLGSAISVIYGLLHQEGVDISPFKGSLLEFLQLIFQGIYYRGIIQNLFPKVIAENIPEYLVHIIAGSWLVLFVLSSWKQKNILSACMLIANVIFFALLIKNRADFAETHFNLEVLIGEYGPNGGNRYFYFPFISFMIMQFVMANYFLTHSNIQLKKVVCFYFFMMALTGMSYFKYTVKYINQKWAKNGCRQLRELKPGESMTYNAQPLGTPMLFTNNREN